MCTVGPSSDHYTGLNLPPTLHASPHAFTRLLTALLTPLTHGASSARLHPPAHHVAVLVHQELAARGGIAQEGDGCHGQVQGQ